MHSVGITTLGITRIARCTQVKWHAEWFLHGLQTQTTSTHRNRKVRREIEQQEAAILFSIDSCAERTQCYYCKETSFLLPLTILHFWTTGDSKEIF